MSRDTNSHKRQLSALAVAMIVLLSPLVGYATQNMPQAQIKAATDTVNTASTEITTKLEDTVNTAENAANETVNNTSSIMDEEPKSSHKSSVEGKANEPAEFTALNQLLSVDGEPDKLQDEAHKAEGNESNQRSISDLMYEVWTSPSEANAGQQIDPFAQRQASWIENLLDGAISSATASEGSFNYFIVDDVKSASEMSSGVKLSQLWHETPFRLTKNSRLPDGDFKQEFKDALNRGFSYISYLLHQNNPYRSVYNIPVLFLNEQGSQHILKVHHEFEPFKITAGKDQVRGNNPFLILDRRYDSGNCAGSGILEADLLGKCGLEDRSNLRMGVVVIPYLPQLVVNEGIYTEQNRHITPNVMKFNALASGVDIASRLAGISSSLDVYLYQRGASKFADNLSTFDQHLYSKCLQGFVKPSMSLIDIYPKCNLTSQKSCALYFVGSDVQRILGLHAGKRFDLGQDVKLPVISADSQEQMAVNRFGSGLYTVSSVDLAQIAKSQAQKRALKEDNVAKEDAAALSALTVDTMHHVLVDVEPASFETSSTISSAAKAATRTLSSGSTALSSASGAEKAKLQEQFEQQNAETKDKVALKAELNAELAQTADNNGVAVDNTNLIDGFPAVPDMQSTALVKSATLETSRTEVKNTTKTESITQAKSSTSTADQTAQMASNDERQQIDEGEYSTKGDEAQVKANASSGKDKVQLSASSEKTENTKEVASTQSPLSISASVANVLSEAGDPNKSKVKLSLEKLNSTESNSSRFGIPVYFDEFGQPFLGLRNTLLSYGDYKNYNFLTEAEMMVLSDLGYSIESAEFYGTSIYSSGSTEQRLLHKITQNFGLYDHSNKTYSKQPSIMPSAVGLHVYGDFNDIAHSSNFNLAGNGAIGVRVDGCDNYYYQQKDSSIDSSGAEGSGVAFTYGRNNAAYIGGKVKATGSKGVAIRVDMGSNINSDLVEFRGSYIRARSLDYHNGILNAQDAAAVPLLEELNGPQVTDLTISGQVEGRRAAIYIDESSLVRNINLSSKAQITGGIYSTWNPSIDGAGNIKVKHDSRRSHLVDAIVQYPVSDIETTREVAARELTTRLNLGVKLDERQRVILEGDEEDRFDGLLVGDPASRTVINGSINGGSIKVRHYDGLTTVNGDVRAYAVEIYKGVLRLNSPESSIHQINFLKLHPNTVLDLVDGKPSQTYVQENVSFDRASRVRVDVDADGTLLDELNYMGQLWADDYQVRIEPAVTYETMKSLATNPKIMLDFMTKFMQQANEKLAPASITVRFPRYIWDSAGGYGRELKCAARGCRMGSFVSSDVVSKYDNIQPWRYYLAFGGLLVALLAFYTAYFLKRIKNKA